ncbi:protein O-mannosyl-transferase TMTC4-like isoform X2 [Zerene cesonia]|nr:protein O-mannosyl-transferase TMTC4-like isoform X2 [Zerene cesonia]
MCCVIIWITYRIILNKIKFSSCKESASNIAYLATLLFCIHPIHVEAICGIVGRADLLAAITFFSSFLMYDKAMRDTYFSCLYLIFAILFAGLSMLFKENGITVLGFCVIYELIMNIQAKERNKSGIFQGFFGNIIFNFKSSLRVLCLVVSIVIMLYLRWFIMREKPIFKHTDNPAAFNPDFFTRVASYNYIYFINSLLFVWPYWLCYDWSMGCIPLIKEYTDIRIMFVILLYCFGCMGLLSVFNGRNRMQTKRLIILAFSLVIIPFLPASNMLFPVGFVIAERILYIPSAGYCLLVAIGFHKILQRRPLNISRNIMMVVYLFLILVYAIRSYQRSFEWQTEYKLFTSGLIVCPLNAKVHYNVAKVADANGNMTWAMNEYKIAIRLYPEYYQAMNNLANLLKNKRQFVDAEFYLRKAISLKEDFPAAWMNLGIVLASVKNFEESEKAYQNALKYRKHYPDCHYNLGNLYLELNKTNMAVEHWFRAIQLNPKHNSAWTNLLALLDNTDQIDKALKLIPQALQELPESPSVVFAIANIYGKIDEYSEAERHFLKSIQLFGQYIKPIHYSNLGVLYHRWKKYDMAETMYKKALEIQPNFQSARKNLESLKKLRLRIKL